MNYDGSVLGYAYCGKGGKAIYTGQTPTRADEKVSEGTINRYTFTGWDKALTNIQAPTIFTAQYEAGTAYKCEFVDGHNNVLYTTYVVKNGYVEYKGDGPSEIFEINSKKNLDGSRWVTKYTFAGWDKELTGITKPTTFKALYSSRQYLGYKVVFQKPDGTVLSHVYVEKGKNAPYFPGEAYISECFSYDSENVTRFAGWDKLPTNVTSDLVIKAKIVTISRHQNGEYPQTKVTDDELISALNNIEDKDAQGYVSYKGEKYSSEGWQDWRKVEPIQWRYLSQDGENVKFVAKKILTSHVWNKTKHENGIYKNNYKYSDIRSWLNSDFF